MRRELERVEIPGAEEADERAWKIVRSAYTQWTPPPGRSHWPRVAVVAVALGAVLAAALSPPGRAVIEEIRSVVGVEKARPALFSLPAPGRLLVASDAGIWVVQQDGSKRLLGEYREAGWSPFGRFVVATRANEIAALEPDGTVRWTIARRGARSPRWGGSATDTRIAYVAGGGERQSVLRVVAGDGTADRVLGTALPLPATWQTRGRHVVAYVARAGGRVVVADADTGRRARSWAAPPPALLEWSHDGRRLFVFAPDALRLYDAGGRLVAERQGRFRHAALRPGSSRLADVAALRTRGGDTELLVGTRVLFRGTGEFREVAWSPDGTWILVTWPTADQWVFVRAVRRPRIVAVSNVARQFGGGFTRIEGWCCTAPPR